MTPPIACADEIACSDHPGLPAPVKLVGALTCKYVSSWRKPAVDGKSPRHEFAAVQSRVLATIPVDLQAEGLSLAGSQTSLRGRWRGNCHPGELGAALRKLGFTRHRRWHGEDGFQAVWCREG
jgi:hypothetical protein